MCSSKGQVFSLDLLIASLVLLVVLVSFLFVWTNSLTRLSYFEQERWREEAARFAVEQMVETPGYPTNWEQIGVLTESKLRSFGLARSRNVLNEDKVDAFVSLYADNYTFFKRTLGLQKYDFRVVITNLDGTELYSFNSAPPDDKKVTTVTRLALLNDEIVEVSVYVWQ